MTENSGIDDIAVDSQANAIDSSSSAPIESASAQASEPKERMLSQSEVNDIVASQKRRSYEKGLQEGSSKREVAQPANSSSVNTSSGDGNANFDQIIDQKVNQRLAEYQEQQAVNAYEQQVDFEFNRKLDNARKNIDGFDSVVSTVGDVNRFRAIKLAVSNLENGGDVFHHLAQNPNKMVGLEQLAYQFANADGSMNTAPFFSEVKKISDQLKMNKNASNMKSVPNPVSQIETNNRDGIGDSSPQSVADFRRIYK